MAEVLLETVGRAGYVFAGTHSVIEAKTLPPNTLAQKAELIALTQALILGEGKIINIYRDSKYAFLVLYMPMLPSEKKEDFYMQKNLL